MSCQYSTMVAPDRKYFCGFLETEIARKASRVLSNWTESLAHDCYWFDKRSRRPTYKAYFNQHRTTAEYTARQTTVNSSLWFDWSIPQNCEALKGKRHNTGCSCLSLVALHLIKANCPPSIPQDQEGTCQVCVSVYSAEASNSLGRTRYQLQFGFLYLRG